MDDLENDSVYLLTGVGEMVIEKSPRRAKLKKEYNLVS